MGVVLATSDMGSQKLEGGGEAPNPEFYSPRAGGAPKRLPLVNNERVIFESDTLPTPACAMVLAAGRGMRMRPLTDVCPKPLLEVQGLPLMQWPMEALYQAGFAHLVVNTAWLGEQIEARFLAWSEGHPGARIAYSHEGVDFGYALETAGGISRALPLLDDVFWVLAGDVYAPDFVFSQDKLDRFRASDDLAHLWLVPNPAHHPTGDFGLSAGGRALNQAEKRYTFSTIALYRRALFEQPWCQTRPGNPQGSAAALAPLLRSAMDAGRVGAELYTGAWTDVGTPERLAELNQPRRD
jgi:MurNAc alpha-1-phosphate uridylyltransferase